MSAMLWQTGGMTVAAGVTVFNPFGMHGSTALNATEANAQCLIRTPGVASSFYTYVTANSLSVSCTLVSRKNNADGALTFPVSAGATGAFEDTAHADTLAAGDSYGLKATTAAGSGTMSFRPSIVFDPSDGAKTVIRFGAVRTGGRTFSTDSTTNPQFCSGGLDTALTEANVQSKFRGSSTTLRHLETYVSANTRSTTTNVRSRINGANGSLNIPVSAAGTGSFEDTSNSDTPADGDLVNTAVITSTGGGNFTVHRMMCDQQSATNGGLFTVGDGPVAVNAGLTRYQPIGGAMINQTTEALAQSRIGMPGAASKLTLYVSANTLTATTTLTFRKNAADGVGALSIGSGGTGRFEDTINVDYGLIAADLVNYKLVTGGTGTSIQMQNNASQFQMHGAVTRLVGPGGGLVGAPRGMAA